MLSAGKAGDEGHPRQDSSRQQHAVEPGEGGYDDRQHPKTSRGHSRTKRQQRHDFRISEPVPIAYPRDN